MTLALHPLEAQLRMPVWSPCWTTHWRRWSLFAIVCASDGLQASSGVTGFYFRANGKLQVVSNKVVIDGDRPEDRDRKQLRNIGKLVPDCKS